MWPRLIPCSLLLLVALSGCSSRETAGDAASESESNCNADAVQGMLGQFASAELIEQTRSQASAKQARVLAPGDAATMDFNPQRVNIHIDEAEVIQLISCG